eukprot:gene20832-7726_t
MSDKVMEVDGRSTNNKTKQKELKKSSLDLPPAYTGYESSKIQMVPKNGDVVYSGDVEGSSISIEMIGKVKGKQTHNGTTSIKLKDAFSRMKGLTEIWCPVSDTSDNNFERSKFLVMKKKDEKELSKREKDLIGESDQLAESVEEHLTSKNDTPKKKKQWREEWGNAKTDEEQISIMEKFVADEGRNSNRALTNAFGAGHYKINRLKQKQIRNETRGPATQVSSPTSPTQKSNK